MNDGVWYDGDWMMSTVTHPKRNAHGPLKTQALHWATVGSADTRHLKYFLRKAEIITFWYTRPGSGIRKRRQKTKYSYMKGPDPS